MKRIDGTVRLLIGLSWILSTAAVLVCVLVVLLPWRGARIRVCNFYGQTVSPVGLWLCKADVTYIDRQRIDEYKPAIFVSELPLIGLESLRATLFRLFPRPPRKPVMR